MLLYYYKQFDTAAIHYYDNSKTNNGHMAKTKSKDLADASTNMNNDIDNASPYSNHARAQRQTTNFATILIIDIATTNNIYSHHWCYY